MEDWEKRRDEDLQAINKNFQNLNKKTTTAQEQIAILDKEKLGTDILKQIEELKNQTKTFEMILGEMDSKTKETINAIKTRASKDSDTNEELNSSKTVSNKGAEKPKVIDLDAENQAPNVAKEEEEKPVVLENMSDDQKKTYLLDQLIKDREKEDKQAAASEQKNTKLIESDEHDHIITKATEIAMRKVDDKYLKKFQNLQQQVTNIKQMKQNPPPR